VFFRMVTSFGSSFFEDVMQVHATFVRFIPVYFSMSAFVGRFRDIFSSRGFIAELIAPGPGGFSLMNAKRLENIL